MISQHHGLGAIRRTRTITTSPRRCLQDDDFLDVLDLLYFFMGTTCSVSTVFFSFASSLPNLDSLYFLDDLSVIVLFYLSVFSKVILFIYINVNFCVVVTWMGLGERATAASGRGLT